MVLSSAIYRFQIVAAIVAAAAAAAAAAADGSWGIPEQRQVEQYFQQYCKRQGLAELLLCCCCCYCSLIIPCKLWLD
jgi:hypothetical protein